MKMALQRCFKSRLFLAIAVVVLTHYAVTYYYTRQDPPRGLPANDPIRDGDKVIFKESHVVVLQANPNHKPKKNTEVKRPLNVHEQGEKREIINQGKGNQELIESDPIKVVALKSLATAAPLPVTKKQINQSSLVEKHGNTTVKKIVQSIEPAVKKTVTQRSKLSNNVTIMAKHADNENSRKVILAWTSLTNKKPMWGIKSYSFMHCPYRNCEITSDRNMLDKADLVIFRTRQLRSHSNGLSYRPYVPHLDFSDMPPVHRPNQIWMDVNQESPIYTHADEEVIPLNGVFNLSVNYLLDSDHSISYIPIVKKKTTPSAPADYSKGKTRMALWFVSHCNAFSGRDQYVEELRKYNITVDIFGKCTGKPDGCAPGNTTCFLEVRSKYKFYLAFENSICTEYITEKFWNTLTSNSYNIPIALGANLVEYEKFAPPASYLHTRNFTSPKALAEYMQKVDKDDKLFNSYHKWRESNEIVSREMHESLHCYMCRQANEKKDGNPKYKNISTYWSLKKNCENKPEPIS